jgi:uncharacterized membrane protein YfcA
MAQLIIRNCEFVKCDAASRNDLSSKVLIDFAISLPALVAGTLLGILMFRNVNEMTFRRIILVILFFSGLSLVI